MRNALVSILIASAAACGGAPKSDPNADPEPEPIGNRGDQPPARSELQVRQEAACEQAGPRLTACAVADSQATMTPQELAKLDLEHTGPVHTREFIKACTASYMSSRQVRVYEVCLAEETDCELFATCLDNAKPQK